MSDTITGVESTYEAALCSSCVVWHFNRDDSGLEPDDPRPMRFWEDDVTVGGPITLEETHDDDGEGHCEGHFSHRDCDGCGAIAGTRYDYFIHYYDLRQIAG